MRVKFRFRIDFAANSWVGPGKIELLEAIRGHGSLSQAARGLGMSYRRAWLLLESLNSYFREPVTRNTAERYSNGIPKRERAEARSLLTVTKRCR